MINNKSNTDDLDDLLIESPPPPPNINESQDDIMVLSDSDCPPPPPTDMEMAQPSNYQSQNTHRQDVARSPHDEMSHRRRRGSPSRTDAPPRTDHRRNNIQNFSQPGASRNAPLNYEDSQRNSIHLNAQNRSRRSGESRDQPSHHVQSDSDSPLFVIGGQVDDSESDGVEIVPARSQRNRSIVHIDD